MYVYWYKYTKLKYGDNTKVCYTDKGCFIVHVKPEDVYADLTRGIETRFDMLNCESETPLPIGRNQKVIELMKKKLGGRIMKEFDYQLLSIIQEIYQSFENGFEGRIILLDISKTFDKV